MPNPEEEFLCRRMSARAFLFFLSLARLLKISSIPILPLLSSSNIFKNLPNYNHLPNFRLVTPKIFFPRGKEKEKGITSGGCGQPPREAGEGEQNKKCKTREAGEGVGTSSAIHTVRARFNKSTQQKGHNQDQPSHGGVKPRWGNRRGGHSVSYHARKI